MLTVALYDGQDPNVDEDDVLLWEIRSEEGGPGGVFTVGSQPDACVETAAFDGAFADNMFAAVEIEDSIGAVIEFGLTDLEPNWCLRTAAQVEHGPDAFARRAGDSCER